MFVAVFPALKLLKAIYLRRIDNLAPLLALRNSRTRD